MTTQTMSYQVLGDGNPKTIIFIHGWPDDGNMWQHQVLALQDDYRCISVTLPNFGDRPDNKKGYEFADLVQQLKNTIDAVQPTGEPVYLVTHDWGAYVGYLFEALYPERVEKMVALDVGGHIGPSSLKQALMVIGYQWTLISCWILGRIIPALGTALTRASGRLLKLSDARIARAQSYFNYPYVYFWRDQLLPWRRKNMLTRYRPQCPVLFIYGADKPLMFHSERWRQILAETGGGYECIEDGAHWFMESHPTQTNELIKEWLPASPAL